MSNYLSCAATAKLVRQALKESFPGVKFSVRSSTYAGGASIDVAWQDGPTARQVKSITDTFEGAYFDGMIDYKGSRYHKLDGEPVCFGADFIFERREFGDSALYDEIAIQAAKWGVSDELLPDKAVWPQAFRQGELRRISLPNMGHFDLQDLIYQGLAETSFVAGGARESATLARVAFAGDDGYGQGTVGRDPAKPNGDQAYKAMASRMERDL